MPVKNKIHLITYPDSLGGDLKSLHSVLNNYFSDIFKGGIHILPPFPSSGDRGFAPKTYLEIEPAFGTWEDIKVLGEDYDILVDLMVNHISRQSAYFQDYLEKGKESEYRDLFITLDKVWEGGEPVKEDVDKIFLRRPKPYSTFKIGKKGEEEKVWTTFGSDDPSEQIDLDVKSEKVIQLLTDFFENFSNNNIKTVRLDAVGYVIKKLGTSCFFVEPEIYEFLELMKKMADSYDMELLPEVHAHYETQYKLTERGYWIYDFILPYTILDTLINKSSENLNEYLRDRPINQFTMLDCHDGIPVLPDLEGLIDTKEARKVVEVCKSRGSNMSLIMSDEHKAEDGFDVHQIGGTFYSVLGQHDDAYLAARAIQFFAPGVPQVYYVGLLAGENDYEAVERTGEIREINRHNYTIEEIEESLEKDVVQRLLMLMRFRNEYPAFDGEFQVLAAPNGEVHLAWQKEDKRCTLHIDLQTYNTVIDYTDQNGATLSYRV
ncbi:sucrose phosphorylase [Evansella tamaricis]|uniref:Sucrose phosphorylase n=1 Tax=Evansella tamaricis TaxID=2069301 RepID=A0ABS6JDU7_9BACI|nr:sucrose phosphorylase [Evansella tamaricis]MBU9711663.1 sucrose phosphorylase [Evansella tamaricis]